jgi:Flp pilus assembly protein TadD
MPTQDPVFHKAISFFQAGKLSEAEELLRAVLVADPTNNKARHLTGVILFRKKSYPEAIDFFQKTIRQDPTYAEAYNNYGILLNEIGDLETAAHLFEKAVALSSKNVNFMINYSSTLRELGRWEDALRWLTRARRLEPKSVEALLQTGAVLRRSGNFQAAEQMFRTALKKFPESAEVHNGLGNVCADILRFDEAMTFFQRAIELKPDYIDAYNNLALVFEFTGQLDTARTIYRRVLSIDAEQPESHLGIASTLFLEGRYEEAWHEYEWRWRMKGYRNNVRSYRQPLWDGRTGKRQTMYVFAEQGFGDTLQFVRYLPLVADRGFSVVLECHPSLHRLVSGMKGVTRVVSPGSGFHEFDTYCPLLSLPGIFQTSLTTIPATVPYLSVSKGLDQKWAERIGARGHSTRIGLVWSGNPTYIRDRLRSIPLDMIAGLSDIPGMEFYNLHKDGPAADIETFGRGTTILNFSKEVNDFADTSAFIQHLDVIITIDSAVAHLAGALAKPVWTLLPFAPDWRWMLHRVDTPWYPTMRLFRQPEPGNWNSVINDVHIALLKLVHKTS